ncbi:MAG: DUF1223 domain-containing protein [Polyangia bacterium]
MLELFTSEGCSSCPPADQLLSELAQRPPESGSAPVIALEWHVDYWNYLGWSDPFSSAAYSERQSRYAAALSAGRVYTPQLVVDGRSECVGSSGSKARALIAQAGATLRKVRIQLTRDPDPRAARIQVALTEPPADIARGAELWLVITESGLVTQVPRGENAGKRLAHGPVVRSLRRLGTLSAAPLRLAADLELQPAWQRQNLRAVVLLQRPGTGEILGAAQIPLGG